MAYTAAFLFVLGLLLLGMRVYSPASVAHEAIHFASVGGMVTIVLSCVITAYAGVSAKRADMPTPVPVSGDFGMTGEKGGNIPTPTARADLGDLGLSGNNAVKPSGKVNSSNAAVSQMPQMIPGVIPSVFSMAQAGQICEGFPEAAFGSLYAGAKGEPYLPYEEKAKYLADKAMRLPFVHEAGARVSQQIRTLFASMIEEQYYIPPQNREAQIKMVAKVEKSLAFEAMGKVCAMKILEIRSK